MTLMRAPFNKLRANCHRLFTFPVRLAVAVIQSASFGFGSFLNVTKMLDVRGMRCPIPVVKAQKHLTQLNVGDSLTILATDAMASLDLRHFCAQSGQEFVSEVREGDVLRFVVRRLI